LADQLNNDAASGLVLEPVIVRTEKHWLFLMAAMLGLMLAAIVLTGVAQMLNPLSDVETINPATLHLQGEFVESNLGTAVEPDGSVTIRLLAEQYMFVPQCAVLPASTLVRFRLTSPDVTHGFFVAGTNANAMVVPGYITNIRTRFCCALSVLLKTLLYQPRIVSSRSKAAALPKSTAPAWPFIGPSWIHGPMMSS
jgi:cytochrome c oxidase subunit 2